LVLERSSATRADNNDSIAASTAIDSDPLVELQVIEKLLSLQLITVEQAMEMTDLTPNGSEGIS